jgi:hypothetical protein
MKLLCLFPLFLSSLFAQYIGPIYTIVPFTKLATAHTLSYYDNGDVVASGFSYNYTITSDAFGNKTISFGVWSCKRTQPDWESVALNLAPEDDAVCTLLPEAAAIVFGPIQPILTYFYNLAPGLGHTINYGNGPNPLATPAERTKPHLTFVPPTAPMDPSVIVYDGLGVQMVKADFTTGAIITKFPVSFYNLYSLTTRPVATGNANEVWATLDGAIAILDMGGGSVLATVPVTKTAGTNEYPVGLAFTNDGASAIEAVAYSKADSSGNLGLLRIFKADTRTLASTLPLAFAPQQLLMAPDGLTAYFLGSGKIGYYDILSGTADLTAPFPSFIQSGGIFIHPDGVRLFCGVCGGGLEVFDLTTRVVTNNFPFSPAPGGGAISAMNMSQDGSTVAFTDSQYNVYILDTQFGSLLATYNTGAYSLVFPGPGGN